MARVIMTAKELVDRLQTLESRPNYYKNVYPYNLCYNHSDGRVSADCVNLYKALLNGYDVNNRKIGYFQNSLSNTGDVNEWGLISQCSDVSQDFAKLKNGEPRLLYMDGHIGGFIGEIEKYGKIYNVCECTATWGGHILYSYVDSRGNRFKSKGGEARGRWTHNGLMTPWVSYDQSFDVLPDTPFKPIPKKSNEEVAKEVLDGKWGVNPERKQRLIAEGYDYDVIQKLVNELTKKKETYYTVQKGDKLSQIAKKFDTTTDEIVKLNNKLLAGEKLRVR